MVQTTEIVLCPVQTLIGSFLVPAQRLGMVLRHALPRLIGDGDIVLGFREPLEGGLTEPADGLGVILRHPLAEGVQRSEVDLGDGIPLGGRLAEAPQRLGILPALVGSVAFANASSAEICGAEDGSLGLSS